MPKFTQQKTELKLVKKKKKNFFKARVSVTTACADLSTHTPPRSQHTVLKGPTYLMKGEGSKVSANIQMRQHVWVDLTRPWTLGSNVQTPSSQKPGRGDFSNPKKITETLLFTLFC